MVLTILSRRSARKVLQKGFYRTGFLQIVSVPESGVFRIEKPHIEGELYGKDGSEVYDRKME